MGISKSHDLGEKFGKDWICSVFLKKVEENYNVEKQGYNYRMCSLNSLRAIMGSISKEQITSSVVPLLLKALKDPVPNVKFTAAKVI